MPKRQVKNMRCRVDGCESPPNNGLYCYSHCIDRSRDPKSIRSYHSMRRSLEYSSWQNMINRCNNRNSNTYAYYGGRGIRVCSAWLDFRAFYSDMGSRPTASHTLERIDADGDYEPSNCCWATKQRQSVNQRMRTDNTSGYRGVSWSKSRSKWVSQIRCDATQIHIGLFEDAAEAAWYRDQYAIQLFGDYAPLNFEYV